MDLSVRSHALETHAHKICLLLSLLLNIIYIVRSLFMEWKFNHAQHFSLFGHPSWPTPLE